MAKGADIPQPRSSEFKLSSEWSYAMSVWYQDTGRLKRAQLYMTRARYHQEREFAELTQARFGPVTASQLEVKNPGLHPDVVDPRRDKERNYRRATVIAKVMYTRNRRRHPLTNDIPRWIELSDADRQLYIQDALAALLSFEGGEEL